MSTSSSNSSHKSLSDRLKELRNKFRLHKSLQKTAPPVQTTESHSSLRKSMTVDTSPNVPPNENTQKPLAPSVHKTSAPSPLSVRPGYSVQSDSSSGQRKVGTVDTSSIVPPDINTQKTLAPSAQKTSAPSAQKLPGQPQSSPSQSKKMGTVDTSSNVLPVTISKSRHNVQSKSNSVQLK